MTSPAAYRSPRTAANAATLLLGACGAATVFSLAAGIRLYGLTAGFAAQTDLVDAENLYRTAGTIHRVALLVSAVTFITWFFRVRVNAEVFDPHGHRHPRGWAIGGWFTPVVALWFPRQIAGDSWQASVRSDESGVREWRSQVLVSFWWGTFLAGNLIGGFGRLNVEAVGLDGYRQLMAWDIASDILKLAAAVLAILFVRKLTAMQEARAAEAAARAYGVPAAAVQG